MRWWIWLLIVLLVLLAVIILLWRESRLRSTAGRSPAHAKVRGNIPETGRPPAAERETVTAPASKPDLPATSPEPAAATDPAGTTAVATGPPAHARPATPGTASPGTQRSSGAFAADSPRAADTSRYQPSTASERASGDDNPAGATEPDAEISSEPAAETAADADQDRFQTLGRTHRAGVTDSPGTEAARPSGAAAGPAVPLSPYGSDSGFSHAATAAVPAASAAEAEPRASTAATMTGEAAPETVAAGPDAAGASGDDETVAAHADGIPHGPYGEGSARPLADGSPPHERFRVKGNDDSGLYHTRESPSYGRTGAEVWFASEEHARAAGYQHWNRKVREAEEQAEVPEGPHGPGSAYPLEDGSSPHSRFTVKGNADSGLFHTGESPYYGRTGAEVWFETPDHAAAAGYKPWNWRTAES